MKEYIEKIGTLKQQFKKEYGVEYSESKIVEILMLEKLESHFGFTNVRKPKENVSRADVIANEFVYGDFKKAQVNRKTKLSIDNWPKHEIDNSKQGDKAKWDKLDFLGLIVHRKYFPNMIQGVCVLIKPQIEQIKPYMKQLATEARKEAVAKGGGREVIYLDMKHIIDICGKDNLLWYWPDSISKTKQDERFDKLFA